MEMKELVLSENTHQKTRRHTQETLNSQNLKYIWYLELHEEHAAGNDLRNAVYQTAGQDGVMQHVTPTTNNVKASN